MNDYGSSPSNEAMQLLAQVEAKKI